jgi:hypothetical protein
LFKRNSNWLCGKFHLTNACKIDVSCIKCLCHMNAQPASYQSGPWNCRLVVCIHVSRHERVVWVYVMCNVYVDVLICLCVHVFYVCVCMHAAVA